MILSWPTPFCGALRKLEKWRAYLKQKWEPFGGYFTILSIISLYNLWMKMIWAHLDFFPGNIYDLVLSEKKKLNSKRFVHVGFLWLQNFNKVLRFCSWYRVWKYLKKMFQMPDFCLNNSILPKVYGNKHFDIHLIANKP